MNSRSTQSRPLFRTVVADPPWRFGSAATKADARKHYDTMGLPAICGLPVRDLTAPSAHLWLWGVNGMMEEAFQVCRAWGFYPTTMLTWCKSQPGVGYYLRNTASSPPRASLWCPSTSRSPRGSSGHAASTLPSLTLSTTWSRLSALSRALSCSRAGHASTAGTTGATSRSAPSKCRWQHEKWPAFGREEARRMKHGPEPHPRDHARIVDALRRGAKVKWDDYEPFGTLREPGTGDLIHVSPWHVEAAYREIAGTG